MDAKSPVFTDRTLLLYTFGGGATNKKLPTTLKINYKNSNITVALNFLELLHKRSWKCTQKNNLQQNTVCLEQQIYASPGNFTQPLVVIVETFRRSMERVDLTQGVSVTDEAHLSSLYYITFLCCYHTMCNPFHILLPVITQDWLQPQERELTMFFISKLWKYGFM